MNRTTGYNIGKFARTIVLAIVCMLLPLTARAGAVMPSAMRVEIEEADGIGKSSDSVSVKIYYRWDNFDIDTTYLGNGESLREIDRIFNRSLRLVDSIYIISSASPEGNVRYNARLSENRGLALKRQLEGIQDEGRIGDVRVFPLGSNFPEFLSTLEADGRVPSKAESQGVREPSRRASGYDLSTDYEDGRRRALHVYKKEYPAVSEVCGSDNVFQA